MDKIRPPRFPERIKENEAVVHSFTPQETRAFENLLKLQVPAIHGLQSETGNFEIMAEMEITRLSRGLGPQFFLSESDKAEVLALAQKLDAIASGLPKHTLCRFANVPQGVTEEMFARKILDSGGVSDKIAQSAAQNGRRPVIYADNLKAKDIIQEKESVRNEGNGYALLVYDLAKLRAIPEAEYDQFEYPTFYARTTVEGATFQDALRAVLVFSSKGQKRGL